MWTNVLNLTVRELQGKSQQEATDYLLSIMKRYDQDTAIHCNRVKNLAVRLASQIGFSEDVMQEVSVAALLHDIGKITIPKNILCKPDKLTAEEFDVIKQHSENGYKILVQFPQMEYVAEYVLYHHERYNGLGYPKGKLKRDIPLISRILTLVDVYESITSDRVYRKAMSFQEAIKVIEGGRSTFFDPVLVDIFLKLVMEEDIF